MVGPYSKLNCVYKSLAKTDALEQRFVDEELFVRHSKKVTRQLRLASYLLCKLIPEVPCLRAPNVVVIGSADRRIKLALGSFCLFGFNLILTGFRALLVLFADSQSQVLEFLSFFLLDFLSATGLRFPSFCAGELVSLSLFFPLGRLYHLFTFGERGSEGAFFRLLFNPI